MTIESIFNETELSIFYRQTGFSFGDFFRAEDGTIFAVDRQSGQIFVGDDLLRSNVHALDSIASVNREDGTVHLKFKDSSSAVITFDWREAEAIVTELHDFVEAASPVPSEGYEGLQDGLEKEKPDNPEDDNPDGIDEEQPLSQEELNEVYSRLLNTGRGTALGYLVRETGMSVEEAGEYLNKLDKNPEEMLDKSDPDPDTRRDGTMTKRAIIRTVKELKPGDKIHIEFKPLMGKLRVYETEYIKLSIAVFSRYFSVNASNTDFASLMDDVAEDLFDYMDIHFFCEENLSEISCHLKRVTVLKHNGGDDQGQSQIK